MNGRVRIAMVVFVVMMMFTSGNLWAKEIGQVWQGNEFKGYQYKLEKRNNPWNLYLEYYGKGNQERVKKIILDPNGIINPRRIPMGRVIFLPAVGMKERKIAAAYDSHRKEFPASQASQYQKDLSQLEENINLRFRGIEKLFQDVETRENNLLERIQTLEGMISRIPVTHSLSETDKNALADRIEERLRTSGPAKDITLYGLSTLNAIAFIAVAVGLFRFLKQEKNSRLKATDQVRSMEKKLEFVSDRISEIEGDFVDFDILLPDGSSRKYRFYPEIDSDGKFITLHTFPLCEQSPSLLCKQFSTYSRRVLRNRLKATLEASFAEPNYRDAELVKDALKNGTLKRIPSTG